MTDVRAIVFFLVFGGVIVLAIAVSSIWIVSLATTTLIKEARMKNEAERELSLLRFDFEKQLALIKVRLERSTQQAKSKAEFAVKALSVLYEARSLLEDTRRWKSKDLRSFADYRSVKQRLDEKSHLMQALSTNRHLAFALFGEEAAGCYTKMIRLFEEVRNASSQLAEASLLDHTISTQSREDYENIMWGASDRTDVIAIEVQETMDMAHRVFGAAVNTPFSENTNE